MSRWVSVLGGGCLFASGAVAGLLAFDPASGAQEQERGGRIIIRSGEPGQGGPVIIRPGGAASTDGELEDGSADAVAAKLRAVAFPRSSAGSSAEARQRFREEVRAAATQICKLAEELHRLNPSHPELPQAMHKRWSCLANTFHRPRQVMEETTQELEGAPSAKLSDIARLHRARAGLALGDVPLESVRTWVEVYVEHQPGDELGGLLLLDLAERVSDPQQQRALLDRARRAHPQSKWVQGGAAELENLLSHKGRTLSLDFVDVIEATPISTTLWRGQPYLVHVWSSGTVNEADFPELSALLKDYGQRGLRLAGVHSLADFGTEDELRRLAREHGVSWPQMLDAGDYPETWLHEMKITRLPVVFLCDGEGRVVAVGRHPGAVRPQLEELVR